ncbi:hypothetical protein V2I01_33045 [Micromonospora sp. BRA006-A]|nr:hypothetical protein [Micromonospora sp. BRA006-A]
MTAGGTTRRPSRCTTAAAPSPRCWRCRSTRRRSSSSASRRSPDHCGCCATSAWATSGSGSRRTRSPAARRNASSSPPSCTGGPAGTRCTCSTSRPSGCTPATSSGSWACCTTWWRRVTRW